MNMYASTIINNKPSSEINAIAVILLYVLRNPVCSSCTPKHPIKLVVVINTPIIINNMDTVLLVVEFIR
jgi:hypothetical protein